MSGCFILEMPHGPQHFTKFNFIVYTSNEIIKQTLHTVYIIYDSNFDMF